MRKITIAITAASYHGNKGAAAMLQSSIKQLYQIYGDGLSINLMSVYPGGDRPLLPFDFISVVPAKPQKLLFFTFPMAILYWMFSWLPPVRFLLKKDAMIRAYTETDLVLDEAGISFVDSRGFVMNTYAAVTMIIPLLLGVPVVKYSQALGSFKSWYNRLLAKLVLPRLSLICARGEVTKQHLAEIGIKDNVKLCADGAFSMPDDEEIKSETDELFAGDDFFNKPFITLSLSSVVDKRCKKLGLDYRRHMTEFIQYLSERGLGVLLIANASRMGNEKSHNNDLPICDAIYAAADKNSVRWYHEEMGPEKIRELIGRSEMLVGSRFHAMIAALERNTPVLLIGWSHKYKEVLDMFELGAWAVDYKELSLPMLTKKFEEAFTAREEIKQSIQAHFPDVQQSSLDNIRGVAEVVERLDLPHRRRVKLLDLDKPERYTGPYHSCRIGYAADETIRQNAASGGMVTALLCSMLREGKIDGAWVTKSFVKDGELSYKTFIATTEDEIKSCSSSIYMEIPQIKHIEILQEFSGRVAVVMLPCQIRSLNHYLAKNPVQREKVVLRIALYCSGNHDKNSTLVPLRKKGISLEDARRVIFRRGHYRGTTVIEKNDGTQHTISYTKTICAYKNAYYFSKAPCMLCQDQFGKDADLSFGDIWLKSMKKNPIKHTSCLIHNEKGLDFYRAAVAKGDITDFHFNHKNLIRSQKRALVFKYNCAGAKARFFEKQNKKLNLDIEMPCRWNHRLAYALARRNQELSFKNPEFVEKIPMFIVYYYMAFIRVLLSF